MAKVTVAPTVFPEKSDLFRAFLAGAIDMGKAVDWQSHVIKRFEESDAFELFNPRRAADFTPDMLDEQIRWELRALDVSDIVFMWFPKDALAPIALFESGLYWKSGKLLVGAEQGFYRRRNLEITAEYYGLKLYDNIDYMVNELAFRFLISE